MNSRHPMSVVHSFSIKNIFMVNGLQAFLFSCDDINRLTLEPKQLFTNRNGHSTVKHSTVQTWSNTLHVGQR